MLLPTMIIINIMDLKVPVGNGCFWSITSKAILGILVGMHGTFAISDAMHKVEHIDLNRPVLPHPWPRFETGDQAISYRHL